MSDTLKETKAVSELGAHLYSFLPGKPHPYADSSVSFPGVANKIGLSMYWAGGSKKSAVIKLLQLTLEYSRVKFCDLVIEIVKAGIIYRGNKNEPITREEVEELNKLIEKVNFKIPELWNSEFLDSLPSSNINKKQIDEIYNQDVINRLRINLIEFNTLAPQARGYAFEKLLNELFNAYKLNPKKSFRLIGEQIDGSFKSGSDVYLLEAKWQDRQIGQSDLLIFRGKVEGKASWSRGLFVSYSGFTQEGLVAFARGKSTNMVGMDGQDLFYILNGEITLVDAIEKKVRRAAETGDFFISIFSLLREY